MGLPRRYVSLEDQALLALVGEGDGHALHALYERYGPASHTLACRVLGDGRLAADVVRAVFLTVWRDAGRFAGVRGCAAWLSTLTHQQAVETVRRTEHLRRRRAVADEAGEVDDETWSGLRRSRVRAALESLPAAEREALTLAYFGGYTQQEVATLTAASLAEVRARLLGALRQLRPLVDDAIEPVR